MAERDPLRVFVTVDTELWPLSGNWPRTPLPAGRKSIEREHDLYILGRTAGRSYGLPFILETLQAHELGATFFIESLHALAVGNESLTSTVALVRDAGQDVQLHVHTEWLGDIDAEGLPKLYGPALAGYEMAEQRAIVTSAHQALTAASGSAPRAFRAGSYGAGRETLDVLAEIGIAFDSSHNQAFSESPCRLAATDPLVQPARFGSVDEFPVSCFEDYANHLRHTQVCATSIAEMRWLLRAAWTAGWNSIVIVLHSSEFIHKERLTESGGTAKANMRLARRFEALCAFLAANRGWLDVATFGGLPVDRRVESAIQPATLRSAAWRTIGRTAEQALNRIEGRWA
ncbi:MAG: polysaccharide deacetylase family protein [Betaproteobacteria bacterium]